MTLSDSIDAQKEQLILAIGQAGIDQLETQYSAVSFGMHPALTTICLLGSVIAFFGGQTVVGVVLALIVLHDFGKKKHYDRDRLHVLARFVAKYIYSLDLSNLGQRVSQIPLRSVKEWSCLYFS